MMQTMCYNNWVFVLLQAPEGENQPSTDVDLFVSTEKIMVLNTDLQVYTIVYLVNTDNTLKLQTKPVV